MTVDIRTLIAKPRGDELFFIECPFHEDTGRPNMAVYKDGTHCFRCGASETAREFIDRASRQQIVLAKRGGTQKEPAPPVEPWMVDVYHNVLNRQRKNRIQWFLDRGIFRTTIDEQRLGHTGEKFVIPIWDAYGNLDGVHYRIDPAYYPADTYYDTGPPKYLNPRGQPALVYAPGATYRGPVVICEGPLDALLLSQMHWNAVTTTAGSGSLPKMLDGIINNHIYIATDRDQAGDKAYMELLLMYPHAKRVPLPEGMDITDVLMSVEPMERTDTWNRLIRAAE